MPPAATSTPVGPLTVAQHAEPLAAAPPVHTAPRDALGQPTVTFEGCDYHALSRHPAVIEAIAACLTHPENGRASTSASRTTTGDTPAHRALEDDLRGFLGVQEALLCPDGYTANMIALQALASGAGRPATSCVVLEPDAHASLHDAARLAALPAIPADRGLPDMADAAIERARAAHGGPVLWATDGVFTAHGRVAPAHTIIDALGPDDLLLIDDSHGLTALGPGGRGTAHAHGVAGDPRVLLTSTLAKGLGSAGGFIAGPAWFIESARSHSDVFIGTTPTSPILVQAARAALRVIRAEPERVGRLRSNAERLHEIARDAGIPGAVSDGMRSQIIAFTLAPEEAGAFDAETRDAGIFIPRMRYPGGPSHEYHRLAVRSTHTDAVLDTLASLLRGRRYL